MKWGAYVQNFYKALLASLSSLWLRVTLHCGFVSTVGLQAALDMQEKITARREQIDTLQVKIQHLEETVEKLHQVKIVTFLCRCGKTMLDLDLVRSLTIL